MPGLNDDILDELIAHQIEVQQMIQSVVLDLQSTINEGNQQVIAELLDAQNQIDFARSSGQWKAALASLFSAIEAANNDANSAMADEFRSSVTEFLGAEADFQVSLLDQMTPDSVDVIAPEDADLESMFFDTPIIGRLADDWLDDFGSSSYDRIESTINAEALGTGDAEAIAESLAAGAFLIGARQLENMTRTLFNAAANDARELVADANDNLVGAVQWHATLDERTCAICADLDGEIFDSVDEVPIEIPAHPSCRCFLAPVTRSALKLGLKVSPELRVKMNGQPAKTKRYAQWLAEQSAAKQDEALGPARGRLFRLGKLPVKKFTDSRHNILTLKQLKARHAEKFKKANVAA